MSVQKSPLGQILRSGMTSRTGCPSSSQAEPFPASIPSIPFWTSGPFLSQFLYSISWLPQSSYQFTFLLAFDGNPGYFERSFASWKNPDVALITRKVTHPDPPIEASAGARTQNKDNIKDHGHRLATLNVPDLVWSWKLSRIGLGQYLDGRPPRNTRYCRYKKKN